MAASEIVLRSAWRFGRRSWDALFKQALPALTEPLGRLRDPRQIVDAWPKDTIALSPDVVLFAHFDRAGLVRPYVLTYLERLAASGLSVVLVSNSGLLDPSQEHDLRRSCAGVLVRRNVGYDFGAWRDALLHLGLPRPETNSVFLVNDSVYGPLTPLRPLIERLDLAAAEAWGLTDSWQQRYHLQSYFLRFGRAALDSSGWRQFWSGVFPVPSKHSIVRRYEIGLTQALLRGGLRCRALWPYTDLIESVSPPEPVGSDDTEQRLIGLDRLRLLQKRHMLDSAGKRTPLNPTSDLWRQLMDAKYPFIKRELLRDNPTRVADVAEWRTVARNIFDADLSDIDRDLERTLRNRSP